MILYLYIYILHKNEKVLCASHHHVILSFSCLFQLRVVRAFKSTLEDMEERRSVHSLHSLRTSRSHPGPRPLSDISYIDEEVNQNISVNPSPSTTDSLTPTGQRLYHPHYHPSYQYHSSQHAPSSQIYHYHNSHNKNSSRFIRNQSLLSENTTGSVGAVGYPSSSSETAPLLTKEPQMERSRSAPFSSPIFSSNSITSTTTASTTGASMMTTTTTTTRQSQPPGLRSTVNQSSVLNNPLVQGYHLLAEPTRVHETSI